MTWEGMEIKEKPGDMLQRTLSSLKSLVLVVRVHKVLSEHSPLPRPLRAYWDSLGTSGFWVCDSQQDSSPRCNQEKHPMEGFQIENQLLPHWNFVNLQSSNFFTDKFQF